MNNLELLKSLGELTSAIDECTDWFVLSRWERDPVKKATYKAIYEVKHKEYLKILGEVDDKLKR